MYHVSYSLNKQQLGIARIFQRVQDIYFDIDKTMIKLKAPKLISSCP